MGDNDKISSYWRETAVRKYGDPRKLARPDEWCFGKITSQEETSATIAYRKAESGKPDRYDVAWIDYFPNDGGFVLMDLNEVSECLGIPLDNCKIIDESEEVPNTIIADVDEKSLFALLDLSETWELKNRQSLIAQKALEKTYLSDKAAAKRNLTLIVTPENTGSGTEPE